MGRSLSHWDGSELARQLICDQVVKTISTQTVQRILWSHHLKPWRKPLWLSSTVPRDEEFCRRVPDPFEAIPGHLKRLRELMS